MDRHRWTECFANSHSRRKCTQTPTSMCGKGKRMFHTSLQLWHWNSRGCPFGILEL